MVIKFRFSIHLSPYSNTIISLHVPMQSTFTVSSNIMVSPFLFPSSPFPFFPLSLLRIHLLFIYRIYLAAIATLQLYVKPLHWPLYLFHNILYPNFSHIYWYPSQKQRRFWPEKFMVNAKIILTLSQRSTIHCSIHQLNTNQNNQGYSGYGF